MDKSHKNMNIELFRILSTVSIIILHTTSGYLDPAMIEQDFGKVTSGRILFFSLVNMMTRYAVPCYLMISGALNVLNDRNSDFLC